MIGEVHHCDWRELAERIERASTLIVDAPYSAKTHAGHDEGMRNDASRSTMTRPTKASVNAIDYASWTPDDVRAFVSLWAPQIDGWMVSITDHVLDSVWQEAMEEAGRYAFAPLPLVETGSRVRLSGDGPSCGATQVVVSRPRTREAMTWGALPGAYVGPREAKPVMGGKPLWAMRALVRDYSRPGDLIVDPCAGGGTTLLAAKLEGRRFVGSDIDAAHVEIARERLRETPGARGAQQALFDAAE
jgi:site-specific DNA-methyltransferase (adenine-specific)